MRADQNIVESNATDQTFNQSMIQERGAQCAALHQTRRIRILCVYVRIRNRFVGFFFIFGHFRSRNEFDTEQLYLTEIKYTFSRVTVLKYLINKGINLI